jgi:hypothetical protein
LFVEKQVLPVNLKIRGFWGTGENAVFSQIWVALIVSVLLWICRTLGGITAATHQILQMIKTTPLCKGSILELCTNKPPPPKIVSPQFLLKQGIGVCFFKNLRG